MRAVLWHGEYADFVVSRLSAIKDVTILVAHPDDEFLFAWPVLRRAKRIIACVDDVTHPQRQWCKRRKEALFEVGKLVGATTECLRHDSDFANKPRELLTEFVEEVRGHIANSETIFTHNAWGEYGHLDHMLLHQVVRMTGKRMLTTDICVHVDRFRVFAYDQGRNLEVCNNDIDLFNQCMSIYKSYDAMRWTYLPVNVCNLLEVT